jgi:hypothetical protein
VAGIRLVEIRRPGEGPRRSENRPFEPTGVSAETPRLEALAVERTWVAVLIKGAS